MKILLLLFLIVLLNVSFTIAWGGDSEDYANPTFKSCPNNCTYRANSCNRMTGVCSCAYGYNINQYDCSDKCSYAGCTKYIDSVNDTTVKGGIVAINGWFDNDYSSIFITINGNANCGIISNSSTLLTCLAPRLGSTQPQLYQIEIIFTDSHNNTMFKTVRSIGYQFTGCLNQCSGVGSCTIIDTCDCLSGFYGEDCSLISPPSATSSNDDDQQDGTIFIDFNPLVMILLFIFILITIITSKK
ncbi:hypothetical protein ACTFIU_008136 [Dictyostelium citrinum]